MVLGFSCTLSGSESPSDSSSVEVASSSSSSELSPVSVPSTVDTSRPLVVLLSWFSCFLATSWASSSSVFSSDSTGKKRDGVENGVYNDRTCSFKF